MKIVTQNDIREINRLYLELKTYAAVSRATGFSPATVKKYIIQDYNIPNESNFIRFDRPLPEFDSTMFRGTDWGELCVLSPNEEQEIRDLWKELDV